MPIPFIGEIRMFAGNYAPTGWAFCDGQQLSISENEELFQLIGTIYGGDGQSTFALPDLRGRLPLHQGNGFSLGKAGGAEAVALTQGEIPAHNHAFLASSNSGDVASPLRNVVAQTDGRILLYISDPPSVSMNPAAITPTGGSLPHENLQPFLCVNFIISLSGIFPSQN